MIIPCFYSISTHIEENTQVFFYISKLSALNKVSTQSISPTVISISIVLLFDTLQLSIIWKS